MDQPNVVTKQREPWNKGKLVGQKSPLQTQGDLGYPHTAATGQLRPGPCPIRLGHRQQATGV